MSYDDTKYWSFYFYGSNCKEGTGAKCILTDLEGNYTLIDGILEISCTEYTTEYEELIQGFNKANMDSMESYYFFYVVYFNLLTWYPSF